MVDIVGMVNTILSNPHSVVLLIFGNIKNSVLSSRGVVTGVDAKKLGLLSILCVLTY